MAGAAQFEGIGRPHLDRADRGRSAHKIPALTCALRIKLNGQLELTHGSARQKIAKKEPSVDIKNQNRAIRYRRLAIAEPDKCKAAFLRKLTEEAERGVLCTVDQMASREVVERHESTGRL